MKFTEEQLSLIKEYIMEDLTQERKELFDENMKSTDFRNEVVQELSIFSAIQESANKSLKDSILGFEGQTSVPTRKTEKVLASSNYLKYIIAGLLVSVLCVVLFLLTRNQNNVTNVYADVYRAYPATEVKRGKVEQLDAAAIAAMDLYRQGDYAKALTSFKSLEGKEESLEIYKGVCFLELEQYENAQSTFAALMNSTTSKQTRQVAEWYTTLILLKTGNPASFESSLDQLINDKSHLFNTEAKELQRKLD